MMKKVLRRALAIGLAGTMLMGTVSVTAASPKDLFDADYYAELYPDVVAAVGDDWSAYMNHMLEHGLYENRHTVDKDVASRHDQIKERLRNDETLLSIECGGCGTTITRESLGE